MTRNSLQIFIASTFILLGSCKEKGIQCESLSSIDNFKVGQIWKYNNRQGEDSSTLTVLKIEKCHKTFDSISSSDTVIHIRIDKIKLKNSKGEYSYSIEHLPCSEKALSKSVATVVGENSSLPDFSNEYDRWKKLYDKGKNLYWGLTIKEAVADRDSLMNVK